VSPEREDGNRIVNEPLLTPLIMPFVRGASGYHET